MTNDLIPLSCNTNRDLVARVSRALRQPHEVNSSFDWFVGLCLFYDTGSVGFTTLN